jgi:magnesium-transporting ATPase (P-type)
MPVIRSVLFACLSSYILAIAFSFRSLHHSIFSYDIFSNRKLNLSILAGMLLLVATFLVPGLRNIFHIDPLPLEWLPFIALWIVFNMALVEGAKYIFRVFKK